MNPIGKLLPGGLAGIGVLFLCGKIYATHARNCELEEELRKMSDAYQAELAESRRRVRSIQLYSREVNELEEELREEKKRRIKAESCLNRLKFNFEAMLIRSGRGQNMTVYQKTAQEEGMTYVNIQDDTCLMLTEDVPQNLR